MAAVPSFSVDEERCDGIVVLNVHGDVDLLTVAEFRDRLAELVRRGERRVLIDCLDTRFIDSKMVEALFAFAEQLGGSRGRLAIACAQPNICRVLALTGVDRVAAVRPSRRGALSALA